MWIIGDVGGQYNALVRLLDTLALSGDTDYLFVGDLVDRGPSSKQVVELVMTGGHKSLMGNHEHLMLDYLVPSKKKKMKYPAGCWQWNGGTSTLLSYGLLGLDTPSIQKQFPKEHLTWLKERPLYYEEPGLFVSHAPIAARLKSIEDAYRDDGLAENGTYILWCRQRPRAREGILQVSGHNSHWGLTRFCEPGSAVPYAICIDDSSFGKLTALHWPSLEVIQENY